MASIEQHKKRVKNKESRDAEETLVEKLGTGIKLSSEEVFNVCL